MEEIVKLINCDKTFFSPKDKLFSLRKKKIEVFKKINLSFKKGEIVALLGPNGAGKTTIFKMLSTLILPNKGKVLVEGFDPNVDPIPVRERVSLVTSEERSFYFRLTGKQNLNFFATLCNLKKYETEERIQNIDRILKLGEHLDKRYQEYSTGLKQKLNLARGLIRDFKIILLDEPVKSVDAATASDVMDYIKNTLAKRDGKTVLFTTHNMNEIEGFADRFVILDKLGIVADFKKDKLKASSLDKLYKSYVRN